LQKVERLIFVALNHCLRKPQSFKTVDQAHQSHTCLAQDVRAFFHQVLSQHSVDLGVNAAKIVATGTFVLDYQNAVVIVLALAHACFSDAEDAFTALAFEPQLIH
jgi:hypothetical protein